MRVKPERVIMLNYEEVSSHTSCETPRTLESFVHQRTLEMLLFSDES